MKRRYPFNKLQSKTRPLTQVGRPLIVKPEEKRRVGRDVYATSRWMQLSTELRKQKPYCERCGDRKSQLYADHIRELADGGAAFDPTNIQILCAVCHQIKTKSVAIDRKWKPIQAAIEGQLSEGYGGGADAEVG